MGSSGCEMFGIWDVWDSRCSGCGMLEMWDALDVGCSGCKMFGMWDVWDVGCSRCGMFGMWYVRDVGCEMLIYKMLHIYIAFYLVSPQIMWHNKRIHGHGFKTTSCCYVFGFREN